MAEQQSSSTGMVDAFMSLVCDPSIVLLDLAPPRRGYGTPIGAEFGIVRVPQEPLPEQPGASVAGKT